MTLEVEVTAVMGQDEKWEKVAAHYALLVVGAGEGEAIPIDASLAPFNITFDDWCDWFNHADPDTKNKNRDHFYARLEHYKAMVKKCINNKAAPIQGY